LPTETPARPPTRNSIEAEFKAFDADDGERLFQFDTLYDEFDGGLTPVEKKTATASYSPEDRAARRLRWAISDTVVVPARDEGFQQVFLGQNQWYAIRIGAAMKDRVKYIAAYRVAPISAVTHIAEVQEIRPYKDTGKYLLTFKGPAQEITPVGLSDSKNKPQSPVYVRREKLMTAKSLEEAMKDEAVPRP
jgi:hypothetical protein